MANYYNRSTMPDYEKTFRSIYSGSDKPGAATFSAWIDRTKNTRKALLQNKSEHKADIDDMTGTWAERVIEERKAQYELDEIELASIARNRIKEDLESVIAAKQKQYDKATGAPTTEQINLINVLKMRAEYEDLSPSDFANVTPKLADNFHALKMLQNIADSKGIAFPRIHDSFREDVSIVRESISNLLPDIDKPANDLGYLSRLFWEAGSFGLQQNVFDKLDSMSYLTTTADAVEQAQLQRELNKAKAENNSESKAIDNDYCSKVRMKGSESIAALCDQFHCSRADVEALNPNVNLDTIHAGMEILIPSTKFSFEPGNPSRAQSEQVTLAKKPVFEAPTGPNGEAIGEDIEVI